MKDDNYLATDYTLLEKALAVLAESPSSVSAKTLARQVLGSLGYLRRWRAN